MAFHAVRGENAKIHGGETRAMYETFRRKSGAGSTITAAGKICLSTAFGRCTIRPMGDRLSPVRAMTQPAGNEVIPAFMLS